MPDSIFYESMRQEITCSVCVFECVCVFFFCRVILLFSSGWKRWNQFYHYNTSGRGEISNYNGLRQMRLISLIWDLKSKICQGNSDWELHWGFPLPLYGVFFLNHGCCIFIQYHPFKGCCEWILMQPWTQVKDYSLPGLTWHIRLRIGISHLSISAIMVHRRCYISHCFYFFVIFYFSAIFLWFFCWLIFVFCFCFHVSWQ